MRISIALLILYLFITVQNLYGQEKAYNEKTLEINRNWHFSEKGRQIYHPATVPGTVHSDLIANGMLEDPFKGTNEEKIQWVENKEWIYITEFDIDANDIENYPEIFMRFEGIDTFAEISLNGNTIINTDNMFLAWEKDVKDILRAEGNLLEVSFRSPLEAVDDIYQETGINYPADNDRHEKHLSVYARKAPYHYGWDWGIRMVGCGIWRPVKLVFSKGYRIEDAFTYTKSVNAGKAVLENEITITGQNCKDGRYCDITVSCTKDGKEIASESKRLKTDKNSNRINIPLEIDSPQIWQPNGWGEQHLYDIKICIDRDGERMTEKSYKTGIRTVEFINENDSIGRNFMFMVNGKPLFAKGTNYIPQDIILTNVQHEDYEKLFRDIKEANMNVIRVWGGGVYEDDYFYELADRHGILVWQDFMFACSTYPGDKAFLENIRHEAEYNIKRLRNHPSLALWCGNNEIYEGIKYWGWNRRYDEATYSKMKADYNTLFREQLDKYVREHDFQRSYIHTSPDSANWGRPATQTIGDIHYWGIWYGKEMFETMDTLQLRFVSEFGFESFPEMKTIMSFAEEKDLSINSRVMTHRQKSSIGNELIEEYMRNYYNMPDNFNDFVYLSLILQGHGISYGIETNRRQRPVCMGSLYWQLNDSWPAISWSAIDYYKNKKALYYHSKAAFAPLMLSAYIQNDNIEIHTISDLLTETANAEIRINIEDFGGRLINSRTFRCDIEPNTSKLVKCISKEELLDGHDENAVVMVMQIANNEGRILYERNRYFTVPKNLKLERPVIEKSVEKSGNDVIMTLRTNTLAKDVFIEIPVQGADFSDNFFDLRAGETKTVKITGGNISGKDIESIKITTLTDTYIQ